MGFDISVVLQQVTRESARRNAGRTLDHPVSLRIFKQFLQEKDFEEATKRFDGPGLYAWGAKTERVHQFDRIRKRRTFVLFRQADLVYRCGVVQTWVYAPLLAEHLWDLDEDGETWSLVMLFQNMRGLKIKASLVNEYLGRDASDSWQGLTVNASPAARQVWEELVLKPLGGSHGR